MKSAKHQKDVYVQCVNSSSLTWQDAFHKLVDMENSGHVPKYVSFDFFTTDGNWPSVGRKLVSFQSGDLGSIQIGMEFIKRVSELIINFFLYHSGVFTLQEWM